MPPLFVAAFEMRTQIQLIKIDRDGDETALNKVTKKINLNIKSINQCLRSRNNLISGLQLHFSPCFGSNPTPGLFCDFSIFK